MIPTSNEAKNDKNNCRDSKCPAFPRTRSPHFGNGFSVSVNVVFHFGRVALSSLLGEFFMLSTESIFKLLVLQTPGSISLSRLATVVLMELRPFVVERFFQIADDARLGFYQNFTGLLQLIFYAVDLPRKFFILEN